ncbi:MAG: hypothetical protein HXY23_02785 [Parvularculaceae bacterium]|nr:hypothetical protein [Parvularculaceae bacterium]
MFGLLAEIERVKTVPTTLDELIAIGVVAISPTVIGPLPIFIDLFRRNGAPSYVPWFVLGFWTLAAAIPMVLSVAEILDRSKMMFGGYPALPQILLAPAFLFPLFFISAYIFALLFGVRRQQLFALVWLGVGALMMWPWLAFAFYGI